MILWRIVTPPIVCHERPRCGIERSITLGAIGSALRYSTVWALAIKCAERCSCNSAGRSAAPARVLATDKTEPKANPFDCDGWRAFVTRHIAEDKAARAEAADRTAPVNAVGETLH